MVSAGAATVVGAAVVGAAAAVVGAGAAVVETTAAAAVIGAGTVVRATEVRTVEGGWAVVAGNVTVTITCLVGAVLRPAANPPAIPASSNGTTHQARRDGAAGARRSDTVMS